MLIDLHVHTSVSACSRLRLEDILEHAKAMGLDGVCLTDHDTMAIRDQVREGIQPDGLLVIVGMEYATSGGDFLIFGPYEDISPGLSASELLRHVKKTGGAAVAAHPCRPNRPLDKSLFSDDGCRIMESVNGRDMARVPPENRSCLDGFQPIEVGGSDAHTLKELGAVATRFHVPVLGRRDLIEALNAGRCQPDFPAPIRQKDAVRSKKPADHQVESGGFHGIVHLP